MAEWEANPELQGELFDAGPGRETLLHIFGGENLDEIYELTPHQLTTAGGVLEYVYAHLDRPVVDATALERDSFILRGRMDGIDARVIAHELDVDVDDVWERVYEVVGLFLTKLDGHDMAEILAHIRELPTEPETSGVDEPDITTVETAEEIDPEISDEGDIEVEDELEEEGLDEDEDVDDEIVDDGDDDELTPELADPVPATKLAPKTSAGPAKSSRSERYVEPRDKVVDPEEDLIRMYLREIGQYELLDKEGEAILSRRVHAGQNAKAELESGVELEPSRQRELRRLVRDGEEAAEEFVNRNLRLVVSIAKKYRSSGLPLLDLIQEGNLGVMHAVEKFDWQKGFKFSTYATWWIRQAITRGIANTGRTIRLPVHAGDTLARVQKARTRLEMNLGRQATFAEIAAEVEMPEDKLTEVFRYMSDPLSLNEHFSEDSDTERGDLIGDTSAIDPEQEAIRAGIPEVIDRMLSILDDRERKILILRHGLDRGEPRTLEEVGEYFHLTRERVRQVEARAMSKLRHPSAQVGGREMLD